MQELSGVILAGGASRRMGRDKAWVELAGRPLIQHVITRLSQVCSDIVIVTNHPALFASLGARLTGDVWPGKGSLGGIYSGLAAARFDHAFVVACDMPFLNVDLLRYMCSLAEEHDLVVPSASDPSKPRLWNGAAESAKAHNLHPLHALYARACLEPIQVRIRSGDLRAISFYPDVRVKIVGEAQVEQFDPDHLSLFNVNTEQDLALAERIISS